MVNLVLEETEGTEETTRIKVVLRFLRGFFRARRQAGTRPSLLS